MATIIEDPKAFEGFKIPSAPYILREFVGKGKIGVVFKAERPEIHDVVACKVIPVDRLKAGWENELEKAVKLQGISEVVQYRQHFADMIGNITYAFVVWEYVSGQNLKDFAASHPSEISLPFIENLVRQVLRSFYAMKAVGVAHGDLHEGNILISIDPRVPDQQPRIRVADFGIGSTSSTWEPSDDYFQLALICHRLLEHIDPALLSGEERRFYDAFVEQFFQKRVVEKDPTVGEFVRDPKRLIEVLDEIKGLRIPPAPPNRLQHAFDYLSCEQIGDSFELLQLLYSQNFPGYADLTQRSNTVLTGPRGCGKTMVFRNLSLKTKALAGKLEAGSLGTFVGVYYQCNDLYYAFPHVKGKPSEEDQRAIAHYFNLAMLFEVLDTLVSVEAIPALALNEGSLWELQGFLRGFFSELESAPVGTDVLRHLKSFVAVEKARVKKWLESDRRNERPNLFLPMDFLKRLCGLLETRVPWLRNRPFYFFLDDYSLPRISEVVQMSLGNFIFDRYSECFFKISTESVTTLCPIDSYGKVLEETREYDVIDLASYFLHASSKSKQRFLREVVNQRLKNAVEKREGLEDIATILGPPPFKSYNHLARLMRSTNTRVLYSGWNLVVDLCSGDIAVILRLIRDIFSSCRDQDKEFKQAPADTQDRAIRENANDFLNRIETIPNTGQQLRKIAEAFGEVAHWYLMNLDSGNQKRNPPWQAFRIELRSRIILYGKGQRLYQDLIR